MIHMRPYNAFEQANIKFLVNKQIDFTTIQVTETGLKKNILDATAPVRAYFYEKKLHDYGNQKQGSKIFVETELLTNCNTFTTKTSMYRPETKDGDPRLWVYGLTKYAKGDDIFILIVHTQKLYVINLTQTNIPNIYNSKISTPLQDFLNIISNKNDSVSDELLTLIKEYFTDWNKTDVLADTGIGRAIETRLGIQMNSSKLPDYKGIELKSIREKGKGKPVLFSQVPKWELSKLKSGHEIVQHYGYYAEGKKEKTMHITVNAIAPTPQKLALNVNYNTANLELIEMKAVDDKFKKTNDVALWILNDLHNRLITKHHETFWIEVESNVINKSEYFRVKSIEHTKNPIVSQFDILLEQGNITVDLLIDRQDGHGDTYSFKLKSKKYRSFLFPDSSIYKIN